MSSIASFRNSDVLELERSLDEVTLLHVLVHDVDAEHVVGSALSPPSTEKPPQLHADVQHAAAAQRAAAGVEHGRPRVREQVGQARALEVALRELGVVRGQPVRRVDRVVKRRKPANLAPDLLLVHL